MGNNCEQSFFFINKYCHIQQQWLENPAADPKKSFAVLALKRQMLVSPFQCKSTRFLMRATHPSALTHNLSVSPCGRMS